MADAFQIEWHGLAEFGQDLGDLRESFLAYIESGMTEYSLLVESGSRALAHRYGGDLEESLIAANVAVRNGLVVGSVGSVLVYAWRLHERQPRNGTGTLYDNGIVIAGYYVNGLGRRTRDKASWKGQMPGRKFLERAVVATEEDFYRIMNRALERAIGGAE